MSDKVVELVQLENGDIILKDSEKSEQEPLMKLSFSDDVNKLLKSTKLDIARVMLEAGIERHHELLLAQEEQVVESKKSNLLH